MRPTSTALLLACALLLARFGHERRAAPALAAAARSGEEGNGARLQSSDATEFQQTHWDSRVIRQLIAERFEGGMHGKADNGAGAIAPTPVTVANGTYQPLSRPVFIYVNKAAVERAEVKAFVDYYLGEGTKLVSEVGYIRLPEKAYELARKRFADKVTGSMFAGQGSKVGVTVEDMLAGE